MHISSVNIIGVGYEGHDLDTFLDGLVAAGVRVLVDVRLNALSRKRGFSKTALGSALNERGIEYVHERALGNPKDNRAGFAEPDTALGRRSHDRYREILGNDAAQGALHRVAALETPGSVALMCFEADEGRCHRSHVLAELGARSYD